MSQPVVASYCTTFLKREMLHIYRQITGLKTFRTFVMTKSRENQDVYPFDDIELLPRPRIIGGVSSCILHKCNMQELTPPSLLGHREP